MIESSVYIKLFRLNKVFTLVLAFVILIAPIVQTYVELREDNISFIKYVNVEEQERSKEGTHEKESQNIFEYLGASKYRISHYSLFLTERYKESNCELISNFCITVPTPPPEQYLS